MRTKDNECAFLYYEQINALLLQSTCNDFKDIDK